MGWCQPATPVEGQLSLSLGATCSRRPPLPTSGRGRSGYMLATLQETVRGSPGPAVPQSYHTGAGFASVCCFQHTVWALVQTPLLLKCKASERGRHAPCSARPFCLSVCLSEVREGEQQADEVSRLGSGSSGVSLKFRKTSLERCRKQLNKTPGSVESVVFIKKELIRLLSKHTAAGAGLFCTIVKCQDAVTFCEKNYCRSSPRRCGRLGCRQKRKTMQDLQDLLFGFLGFLKLLH